MSIVKIDNLKIRIFNSLASVVELRKSRGTVCDKQALKFVL